MTDPRHVPVEVRAPRGGQIVEITWGDGHVSRYTNEILRGYCPCAGCQGHSGDIQFVPGGDTRLDGIDEVGNYALALSWGDGHATGIYSFPYLRRICACEACLPGSAIEKRGTLPRQ